MAGTAVDRLRRLTEASVVTVVTVLTAAIATALVASLALAWSAEDEGAPAPTQAEVYLKARQELAPVLALSREELDSALAADATGALELTGALAGMASCAVSTDATDPMSITLDLEEGGSIGLRAPAAVGELRVGEPVCVIAQMAQGGAGCRDLRVRAWVALWDLPPELRPHAQVEPAPAPAAPTPVPPPDDTPQFTPQEVAPTQSDAVQVWKGYVLEHNPKLSGEQAESIVRWVLKYSAQHNVNHKLIFAVIKWESWFNPSCVSHSGAIGLMQLMPGTARGLGVDPWNVQQNIEGGVHYLAEQLATYADRPNGERVILALACYNAGPNAVKRAGGVPNIQETQRYVRKVSTTFRELHEAGFP